ncbi:MAG: sugar phosphate isomerase/epimerase family protein, partial [Planctomycetota bacterium]
RPHQQISYNSIHQETLIMNRRDFLAQSACAAGAIGIAGRGLWATTAHAAEATAEKMQRIGCTTTCFRMHFASTRPAGVPQPEWELNLLDVPALFAEKFGVHNVEIWSQHVAEPTADYAKKLQEAAAKAGSKIVNVQLDSGKYNLSDPDKAGRAKSLELVMQWIDFSAACGAPSMRANTGGTPQQKLDLAVTGDSFARLARYGEKLGVKILVENHGGLSLQAENVAAIVKSVDSPWCRALPDFGNLPKGEGEEYRTKMLEMLFPLAALASVKSMQFDASMQHVPYDIGRCVKIGEECGFKGIYSVEHYDSSNQPFDAVAVVRRVIEIVLQAM